MGYLVARSCQTSLPEAPGGGTPKASEETRYLRVFSFPDIRLLRVDPQDPVWIYLFLQKLAFSCPFTPQTRYPRIQPNKGVAEEEERERAATDDDAKP